MSSNPVDTRDAHLYPHGQCKGCEKTFETTNQRLLHRCTPAVSETKAPCRDCREMSYHKSYCTLNRPTSSLSNSLVLDSERVAAETPRDGTPGIHDPERNFLPVPNGQTEPHNQHAALPAERIWIGATAHQLNQIHVRRGGSFSLDRDKYDPETDIEYLAADPVRQALEACEKNSSPNQLSTMIICESDWEALVASVKKGAK